MCCLFSTEFDTFTAGVGDAGHIDPDGARRCLLSLPLTFSHMRQESSAARKPLVVSPLD